MDSWGVLVECLSVLGAASNDDDVDSRVAFIDSVAIYCLVRRPDMSSEPKSSRINGASRMKVSPRP